MRSRNRKGNKTIKAPRRADQKRARKLLVERMKKSKPVNPTIDIKAPNSVSVPSAAAKA